MKTGDGLHNQIANLLLPFVQTQAARQELLSASWGPDEPLIAYIDFSGAARPFTHCARPVGCAGSGSCATSRPSSTTMREPQRDLHRPQKPGMERREAEDSVVESSGMVGGMTLWSNRGQGARWRALPC